MKKLQLTIAWIVILGVGCLFIWIWFKVSCYKFWRCPSFTEEGKFINECKRLVEERLKSPWSATFGEIIPSKRWIEGYVDSQNGFWAIIRSNFACSNDWSQISLEMIK